jgi:excisionase family DNA binding protein
VGESFEVVRAVENGAIRITDIASLLGCGKQRVVQLAAMNGFPAPFQTTHRKRLWHRSEVEAWAESRWWGTRPCRVRRDTRNSVEDQPTTR